MAQVMISVHCATMLAAGNALKKYILDKGYTVFLCDQIKVGDDFRHLICLNAAQCKYFIPFINEEWCISKECCYEFNIALSTHNRCGSPDIIPVFLESFDFFRKNIPKYPVAFSLTCNYQGYFVTKSDLNDDLWAKVNGLITGMQGKTPVTPSPHKNKLPAGSSGRPLPQSPDKVEQPTQEGLKRSMKQVAIDLIAAQQTKPPPVRGQGSVGKLQMENELSNSISAGPHSPKREDKIVTENSTIIAAQSPLPPSPAVTRTFPSGSSSPPAQPPPAPLPVDGGAISSPRRTNVNPADITTPETLRRITPPPNTQSPLRVSQTSVAANLPLPASPSISRAHSFLFASPPSSTFSAPSMPPSTHPSPAPLPVYHSDPSFNHFSSPSFTSPSSSPSSSSPNTKLLRALWAQNADAVAQALEQGARVNDMSPDGITPLYIAARLGFMKGISALLGRGVDVNMRTVDGETPLFASAQNGHAEVVGVLASKGADYNAVVGPMRHTPLMQACIGGYLEVVKQLVRCKYISLNAQEMQYGMTALCYATAGGHGGIVRELLAFNADPNVKTWEWSTALLIASANGYAEIVRELCMKQANAGVQDRGGETALHRAVLGGHVEAVLALVYEHSNPVIDVRNNHNATPLFIACALRQLSLVRVLIQVGADVNTTAKHETALSVALARANIDVVLELLQCGVKHDLDGALVDTIIAGQCSNHLTNNNCRQQFWFQCLDCHGESESSRLCLACALVLHRDHTIRYHSFTYYMCISSRTPSSPQQHFHVVTNH